MMSSNNYLEVKQTKKGYEIWDKDSDNDFGCMINKADTLEDAVNKAQSYQEVNIVEYGIHFKLLKERS